MARTKGRIVVIGRVVNVSSGVSEIAFAGMWTPMGSSGASGPRLASRSGGAEALEPTACVLERVEWTPCAHEFAQPLVRRMSRMQLPHLHPELVDDWQQIRLHVSRRARAAGAAGADAPRRWAHGAVQGNALNSAPRRGSEQRRAGDTSADGRGVRFAC
jgi:hypothetical protein